MARHYCDFPRGRCSVPRFQAAQVIAYRRTLIEAKNASALQIWLSFAVVGKAEGVNHVRSTILVVEDTVDSRDLIRLILETEAYRVLEAPNGLVAVDVAKREQPDLILMDMSLPLMDGCEATRRIRQIPTHRTTPIIAFTAYNQWAWRSKAILAGCTDFLTKPVQTNLLFEMLVRYLPKHLAE